MKHDFCDRASSVRSRHSCKRLCHYGLMFWMLLLLCCLMQNVIAQNSDVTSSIDLVGSDLALEACCLGDTCEMLNPQNCVSAGGSPMGPGSQCVPPEACCFRGGSCQDLDPSCCIFHATGTPLGAGTTCLGDNNNDNQDDACTPPQFSCDSVNVFDSLLGHLPCTQGITLQYNNNPSLIYKIQLIPQNPVTILSATSSSPFIISSQIPSSVTWAESGGNPIATGAAATNVPIGTFTVNTGGASPQNYTIYFLSLNDSILCINDAFGTDCPPEPECPNNILQNWSFEQGSVVGPMTSTGQASSWNPAYGSPDVATSHGGCGDNFYVAMWGNLVVGEGLHQTGVTLTQGSAYQISLCVQWAQEPNRPYQPRFRVRAGNVLLTSPTDPNGVTMGITPFITTPNQWVTFTLPAWTAPSSYSIVTISPENQSAFNHGDSTTYAYVDRICIREVPDTCVTPPKCMVAWYPLDETTGAIAVNDIAPPPSSSMNNVGTPVPGPIGMPNGPVPVPGIVGNRALYFYTPHYVDVPSQSDLNFGGGSFSIDGWIRAVGCGPGRLSPIVDKLDTSSNTGYSFYLDQPVAGNAVLKLQVDASTFTSTGTLAATANPSLNTGPWYHIAVTVNVGTGVGTFYINGSTAGTFTALAGPSSNTVSMWIGEIRVPGGRCEIAIDELELFSCALTPSEISSIWAADSLGKCKPAGLKGDPTGDGNINVLDIVTIVNHILDIAPLSGDALDRADCNSDGMVDVLDALGIVNVILGTGECAPSSARPIMTPQLMDVLESLRHYLNDEDFDKFMVLVKAEIGIPEIFHLAQNYPNPFNPTTDIRYQIADRRSSLHITLKIFNLLGQEVRTLVNEIQEPGYYSVSWDGRDEAGLEVSSGVYFYRLVSGEYTATKRMVLMK
ncbi:MAG: T9SS type A sorting domain-containing protein [Gemmatimonadota bacterium]|nr:MAG: T9SS type A sorting domain-containing protein [Gemmatimonadota bacterium]